MKCVVVVEEVVNMWETLHTEKATVDSSMALMQSSSTSTNQQRQQQIQQQQQPSAEIIGDVSTARVNHPVAFNVKPTRPMANGRSGDCSVLVTGIYMDFSLLTLPPQTMLEVTKL